MAERQNENIFSRLGKLFRSNIIIRKDDEDKFSGKRFGNRPKFFNKNKKAKRQVKEGTKEEVWQPLTFIIIIIRWLIDVSLYRESYHDYPQWR